MAPTPKRIPTPGMDNIKSGNKRKSHPRKRVATETKVMPRLRLEPRINSKPAVDERTEIHSVHMKSEPETHNCVPFEDGPIEEIEEQILGDIWETREEISAMMQDRLSRFSPIAEKEAPSSPTTIEEEPDEDLIESPKISGMVQPKMFTGLRTWSDRELRILMIGLQTHGFGELDKIADTMKTKKEDHIRQFIKNRISEVKKRGKPTRQKRGRSGNSLYSLSPENVSAWPNARKWRKMACDQMLSCIRSRDYSRLVMSPLFQKFYEEEEEPTDPQMINVKAVYKYLLTCANGHIPPLLKPKESDLVMSLLKEVRSLLHMNNFEEENNFLMNYKAATKFRPIHVKDEFKKRFIKKVPEDSAGEVVSVAESVFLELSRHKRIAQTFNPMVTPVWLLHREQELLKKCINE